MGGIRNITHIKVETFQIENENRHLLDTSCVLAMLHACFHKSPLSPEVDMIVLINYLRRLMHTEIKEIASSHSAGKREGERSFKLSPVAMISLSQHWASW